MAARASRKVTTPTSFSHYDVRSFSNGNDGLTRGNTPLVVLGPTAEVQEAYEGPLKSNTYHPPSSAPIDGTRKSDINFSKTTTVNNDEKQPPQIDRAQMIKILD